MVTGSNLAGGHLSRAVARRLGAHAGVRFVSVHALASSLAAGASRRRRAAPAVAAAARAPRGRPGRPSRRPALVLRAGGRDARTATRVAAHRRRPARGRRAGRGAQRRRLAQGRRPGGAVRRLRRRPAAPPPGRRRRSVPSRCTRPPPGRRAVLAPGVPIAVHGLYDLPAMQADLVAALAGGRSFAAFLPWNAGVAPYVAPAREFYERPGARARAATGRAGSLGAAQAASARAAPRAAAARARPDIAGGCRRRPRRPVASPVSAAAAAASPAGVASPAAAVRIVSVADDIAERRAVTAELLRAAGAGLAFHEMAVVAPDRQGRDRLARALRAQGIPVAARGADDGVAARTCRLLLDCLLPVAGRPLRRDAVIDLAATAPRSLAAGRCRHAGPLGRSLAARPDRRRPGVARSPVAAAALVRAARRGDATASGGRRRTRRAATATANLAATPRSVRETASRPAPASSREAPSHTIRRSTPRRRPAPRSTRSSAVSPGCAGAFWRRVAGGRRRTRSSRRPGSSAACRPTLRSWPR